MPEVASPPPSVAGGAELGLKSTTATQAAVASESTPAPEPKATPASPDGERGERVSLAGRVGAAPTLRTTRGGVLVAKFPLGVHEDTGATSWHTILAFKQRAEQVRDHIKRGDAVEVIGYRHTRHLPSKGGRPGKAVAEVNATVIKLR